MAAAHIAWAQWMVQVLVQTWSTWTLAYLQAHQFQQPPKLEELGWGGGGGGGGGGVGEHNLPQLFVFILFYFILISLIFILRFL